MMLKVTYEDGDEIVTITWTPDYGFIMAGKASIVERFTLEEVEPRYERAGLVLPAASSGVPVPPEPDLGDDDALGDDGLTPPAKCFACGHAWHEETCERTVDGMECGCMTAVA